MDHHFVTAMEKALGWDGPRGLGAAFARGTIEDLDLLDRLLNPKKLLDLVMRRSVTTPQFRIFQDGAELHPGRYIHPSVTRRGQAIPMADMHRVGALMREGCTIVLDEVDFFDPAMEATCRALQWWARELVRPMATPSSAALAPPWPTRPARACAAHGVCLPGTPGRSAWSGWTTCRLRTSSWSGPGSSWASTSSNTTAVLRSVWQPGETWGMSPLGGGNGKVWEDFDPRPFLRPPHDGLSRVQAAFRTAFHLPSAAAVAATPTTPVTWPSWSRPWARM